jgi:PHS family inorganic phosphate transporter-like MFS transporter
MMCATFSAQGWGQFSECSPTPPPQWQLLKLYIAAAIVGLICVAAYHGPIIRSPTLDHVASIDPIWRLVIGLGCVPGVIALYFRLTIPETPRFTMDIERNIQQASADIKAVMAGGNGYVDPDATIHRVEAPRASWSDFWAHFGKWENGKVLLGTSWSWFALDVSGIL